MKIIDAIKELSTKLILSGLFAFLGFLIIGSIYSDISPTILQKFLEATPKPLLLKLLLLATAVCILLAVLSLYFYLQNRNKLVTKFCALWDKNKEAYCPVCKTALSEYFEDETPSNYSFKCIKCNKRIYLENKGKPISLTEAHKLLK